MPATLTVVEAEPFFAAPIPVDVRRVKPGDNDRTQFDPDDLAALAEAIRADGIQAPPILRRVPPDANGCDLQIVAGERRTRAMRDVLGWDTIPAYVRELTDAEAAAIMLQENTCRVDLSELEEAAAYQSRIAAGSTVAQVAATAGKSARHVDKRLALLTLDPMVREALASKVITVAYAQAVADANLPGPVQQEAMRHLARHPEPTVGWWKSHLADLRAAVEDRQASQGSMFDGDWGAEASTLVEFEPDLPPLPGRDEPPAFRGSATARLQAEAGFWRGAAEQWATRHGNKRHAETCRLLAEQLARSAEAVRGSDVAQVNDLLGRLAAAGVGWDIIATAMG